MVKKKTKKIAIIDAETDPFAEDTEVFPFVWGLYIPEDGTYYEFWNDDLSKYGDMSGTDKLMEFIQDEEYRIYAHNGGKFDFMFLLKYFEPELTLVNGRIAKAQYYENEFYDSWMILPVPLSQMEKELEFDYSKMHHKKRAKYKDDISRYLKVDCVGLGKWVMDFIGRFGTKFTLASTSFQEIKKSGRDIENTTEFHDERFRAFYFGGRTQCFKKGAFKGNFVYYDINSAYPYAMLFTHPIGTTYVRKENPVDLPPKEKVFFARITALSRGCLPYRDSETDKLQYFDDGVIREYYATGWEIYAGLETGTLTIKSIQETFAFVTTENFQSFINTFYEEKNNSQKGSPEYLFAKLIMNSGYGKFGMDSRKFKEYKILEFGEDPNTKADVETGDLWTLYCDYPDYSVYERPNPTDKFYNVATAASITGFVRAYLWRHICASKEPLYCDTDSLICREFSGKIGTELGEWDLECELSEAYIAQRKMYAVKVKDSDDWKTASKGVRLTWQQIKHGVETQTVLNVVKESPAFSVKYGQRFFNKNIDFNLSNQ